MCPRPGPRAAAVLAVALLLTSMPAVASAAAPGAGDPTLTDDAVGALFGGATLSPGPARRACLTVTAAGAQAGDRVTVAAEGVSGALARYLRVTIEAGTGHTGGPGPARCADFSGSVVWSGTLADLGALPGDGADTGWDPSTTASRAFRIGVTVVSDPAAMGGTTSAGFVWRLVGAARPVQTPTPTGAPSAPPPPPTGPTAGPTGGPTDGPVAPVTPLVPSSSAGGAGSPSVPSFSSAPPAEPTPRPSRSPRAEVTVPGLPGRPGGAAGPGGAPEAGGGIAGSLSRAAARIGRQVGAAARQAADVVQGLVKQPQYSFTPILLAVLFLLVQHLIDLRDPKLAAAFRTQRDMTVEFPADYEPGPQP